MTWDATRDAIVEWCERPPLVLRGRQDDADGSTLQIAALGRNKVTVEAYVPATKPAEVTVGLLWAAEDVVAALPGATRDDRLAALEAVIDDVTLARPGRLACSVRVDDHAVQVVILCPVDEDGFSRQSFLAAVADVGKAHRQIERYVAAIGDLRTGAEEAAATAGAPVAADDPVAVTAQVAAVAAPPGPAAAVAPWVGTHWVPAPGLAAWAHPDASQPPSVQLAPPLVVRLVERAGGWARVDTENGWTGWVDGARLG
ncbi:MAG: hypothetical protein JWN46_2953 [Acidimicrobiales bacterium]|nr:hypothetical protein [Acidimicrobiales bacterium]